MKSYSWFLSLYKNDKKTLSPHLGLAIVKQNKTKNLDQQTITTVEN